MMKAISWWSNVVKDPTAGDCGLRSSHLALFERDPGVLHCGHILPIGVQLAERALAARLRKNSSQTATTQNHG
jgi:hypothetical protein